MLPQLTARQKQIYEFVAKTIRENGFAPSILEIGARFKIASSNGVFRHLKALEKKGFLRRVGKRAIEVVTPAGRALLPDSREIPILGRVPAGKPLLAEENVEGFLTVAGDLARGKVFAVKVAGDSMIEAAILDGDHVIVRSQGTADHGDIVCALLNGEVTLKRLQKKGDAVVLKAENKNYAPITVTGGEFRILGKVVGLIRKL
ncbi:MAG: transcriptional repressor LexA [Candidatus Binatia bacterium]